VTLAVPRIDARGLSPEAFAEWDGVEPVILQGLDIGLDADVWQEQLLQHHGDRRVNYRQQVLGGMKEAKCDVLKNLLSAIYSYKPPLGVLAMDELLLGQDKSLQPSQPELLAEDFLQDLFPPDWCPPKFCVVLGTPTARSALHTDPFGWTGWNFCLRGEKCWRFIPPSEAAEGALRIKTPAHTNLAAHGESPVDLYTGSDPLCPECVCSEPANAYVHRQVVQQAGELIVFPASWWHQTYHVTPTVAIASQYVNRQCARRVLDRIVSTAQLSESLLGDSWRSLSWPDQVLNVCTALEADGWSVRRRTGVSPV